MMPATFRELDALLRYCRTLPRDARIISVDGVDGSGKTYLASRLAEALSDEHAEVDAFLDRNKGGYIEHLRYNGLRQCIDDHVHAGRSIVVDGVCIEWVWDRLLRVPTYRVYVKRMGVPGPYWKDEADFTQRTADEVLDRAEQLAAMQTNQWVATPYVAVVPPLEKEVIRYHYERKPQEIADIIYERIE